MGDLRGRSSRIDRLRHDASWHTRPSHGLWRRRYSTPGSRRERNRSVRGRGCEMKSVLYLCCPPHERAETEKQLGAAGVSALWGDTAAFALNELQQRNVPVLLDLSRGAAALQIAGEIRSVRV